MNADPAAGTESVAGTSGLDIGRLVVFFDIGNTLASARVSNGGAGLELTVFPGVLDVLNQLRAMRVRLGILSDRGSFAEKVVLQAMDRAQLLSFFERDLVKLGPKNSTALFKKAAKAAGKVAGGAPELVFCGEDPIERLHARTAGYRVVSHPRLVVPVLVRRARSRWLRVVVPASGAGAGWRSELRELPVVPLHLSVDPAVSGRVVLYCTADSLTAARLDDLGFWVDRLGAEGEPEAADLYILRDDRQANSGFLTSAGNSQSFVSSGDRSLNVLTSTPEGLVVSIPAGQSVESFHFEQANHGHNLKLVPSMGLLDPPETSERIAEAVAASPEFVARGAFVPDGKGILDLSQEERRNLKKLVSSRQIRKDVDRYTGASSVSGRTKIDSRHIHHPGNAKAVTALCADFLEMGSLEVRTHRFTHEGRHLENVEAILPAKNGAEGIVLVTAHMDSTGARQAGYSPSSDAAPGADDDASGVAGVLAAARAMVAMEAPGRPRREMRFVMFNAEEHGLVGSRAYAGEQSALGAKIVAVFQLDMIGHDVNPGRTFELHTGFTPSPTVQGRSGRLAELVAAAAGAVSSDLPAPQIYPGPTGGDPAESRSDHYSFQLEGYAACLATEDFFAGPAADSPAADPNPNYHLPADRTIDSSYAADIARAMTAAAWLTATR